MDLVIWFVFFQSECHEAVLHVSDWILQKEYCLVYNASWSNISSSLTDAVSQCTHTWANASELTQTFIVCVCVCIQARYRLVNKTSTTLCDASGVEPGSLKGVAVCVMRGGCGFSQKAQVAQQLGAAVLLIASREAMVLTSRYDITCVCAAFRFHTSLRFLFVAQ